MVLKSNVSSNEPCPCWKRNDQQNSVAWAVCAACVLEERTIKARQQNPEYFHKLALSNGELPCRWRQPPFRSLPH